MTTGVHKRMSKLLDFYRNQGTDGEGRSFADVLDFDLRMMERDHVYMQWMFPVPERSKAQPKSPVMTGDDLEEFQTVPEFHAMAREAYQKFAMFLQQTTVWQHPLDHNHLRITRALRFLTLIGLNAEARALHGYVSSREFNEISEKSLWYWAEALNEYPAWLTDEPSDAI
ncbi:MAG: opioid growth factor receptor-related protein [Chloroflexi bacterium]|nr:opioid growth factor receptor-related protein [Chloroflexota bacterium]